MKIAFISFSQFPEGGAVAHRQFMMAKGLASLGHKVYLIFPLKYSWDALTANIEGVEICCGAHAEKELSDTFIGKIRKRIVLFKTARAVFEEGLDWLIMYNIGIDGIPYYFTSKIYDVNIAMENNELRTIKDKSIKVKIINIIYRISETLSLAFIDLNIASSTLINKRLTSLAPRIPILNVFALVDVEKYKNDPSKAEAFRKKYGLEDEIILSYLGGYHRTRGCDILLRACRILDDLGNKYKLVIGGRVVKQKEYVDVPQLVENLNLKNVLVLKEWLGPEQLIAAYSAADILVIPNIDNLESQGAFPHKLAEYLSMGKPIAASEVGDIPTFLHHGENALLCKPGDPVSLASALSVLIDDPALRRRLSKNARETAKRYFDCRMIAGQIENKFYEVLRSSG
jgi:glycosyltransferase involved in cell wall biosynthesis